MEARRSANVAGTAPEYSNRATRTRPNETSRYLLTSYKTLTGPHCQ
jgi:hypothetical protein